MREIPLTQGKVALVDDEDFDFLNQWAWYAHRQDDRWCAVRNEYDENKKLHSIKMHRVIMGMKKGDGKLCDHRDLNALNNQKYNLREATKGQNNCNRAGEKNSSSRYKGVSFFRVRKKGGGFYDYGYWIAQVRINGTQKHLGYFKDEIEAAKAYNNAAKELHGEFAYQNIV